MSTTSRRIITTHPDPPAPSVFCPICSRSLVYRHTIMGTMTPIERYDQFECLRCGHYELRHRTNKLRAVPR